MVDIDTRTLPLSRSVSARISGPCTTKAQRSPGSILALACGLFGDNNADIFPSGYSFLYEIIGYERTGQSKIWISFILDRCKLLSSADTSKVVPILVVQVVIGVV